MAHECASGADVTGCGIGRPGACRRVRRSRSERRARGRAAVVVQLAVRRLLEPRGRVRALAVVVLQSFVRMLLVEWRRGLGIFVPGWKQEQEEAAMPNGRAESDARVRDELHTAQRHRGRRRRKNEERIAAAAAAEGQEDEEACEQSESKQSAPPSDDSSRDLGCDRTRETLSSPSAADL